MKVKLYIPHPALNNYVFSIATVDVLLSDGVKDVVTPYPPTPFQSLMFYCNHPVSAGRIEETRFDIQPIALLTGPQFSRMNVMVHRQLTAIRVDFLPGGMYRLLGIPMHELCDGGFDAVDFFGADMRRINEQLQNATSLEEGKNIVETFLLNKVAKLKVMLPIDGALRVLLNHHGTLAIEQTASLSCLSLKQFERKCKDRIGMNPKMFSRILKFSKAYRLHESSPELHWIQIAYDAGYYDQMHMIRDFKAFAGVNPSVIEQQLMNTPLRMQKDIQY